MPFNLDSNSVTALTVSTTPSVLVAASATRKPYTLTNESASASLYVAPGTTAATKAEMVASTDCVEILPGASATVAGGGGLSLYGVMGSGSAVCSLGLPNQSHVFKLPIVFSDTHLGAEVIDSLVNDTGSDLIIHKVCFNLTTPSGTLGATADIGVSSDGSADDTIMTAFDIKTAAALFDTDTNKGASGATSKIWASGDYVVVVSSAHDNSAARGTLYVYCNEA